MKECLVRTAIPVLAAAALCLSCSAPDHLGSKSGASSDAAADPAAACRAGAPDALAVPGGAPLKLALSAEGVQIYTCTQGSGGAAWNFTGPEATLLDSQGAPAGVHGAGPSWTHRDGSRVVGEKVAAATPNASAIPWLLLRVASHSGAGFLEQVTFVRRVATQGGLAPASGCEAASVGAVARVPYRAVYCFH
jgi:Protein of unknown function (DUF3455)